MKFLQKIKPLLFGYPRKSAQTRAIRVATLLFGLALGMAATASAQTPDTILPSLDFAQQKDYEIGGVRVSGTQYADANTLISLSGLKVGNKVRVPGTDFSKAVRTLWNLKLFTDVRINQERTVGDKIFLEIAVQELPRYTRHSFVGVKKSKHDDLNGIINKFIQKGAILTDNVKATLVHELEEHYVEKGFLNAHVKINSYPDEKATNASRLEFVIAKGKKIKIQDIRFNGNDHVKSRVLRKKMKETHRKRRIFKKSKLVRELYEEDKRKIEAYYNNIGYRDARVAKDSIWRTKKGRLMIQMDIDEGNRYYFRNIRWKGNTLYETKYLDQVLGIKKEIGRAHV